MPVALAVFAHPDDIELTASGTLAAAAACRLQIHYMTRRERIVRVERASARRNWCASGARRRWPPAASAGSRTTRAWSAISRCSTTGRRWRGSPRSCVRIGPDILLTHSPSDYMEDHENTCRLAVTAAFARGMPNFPTDPPTRASGSARDRLPRAAARQPRSARGARAADALRGRRRRRAASRRPRCWRATARSTSGSARARGSTRAWRRCGRSRARWGSGRAPSSTRRAGGGGSRSASARLTPTRSRPRSRRRACAEAVGVRRAARQAGGVEPERSSSRRPVSRGRDCSPATCNSTSRPQPGTRNRTDASCYCEVPTWGVPVTGFPSASSTTISPSCSSRMPGSIFGRSPTSSSVAASGFAYFFAAASACASEAVLVASYSRCSSVGGSPRIQLSADLLAEPSQRLELLRVAAQPPFARGGELRFGDRLGAGERLHLAIELHHRFLGLVRLHAAARRPEACVAHQREVREHAVRVALVLAQVQVQPRAEAAAAPDGVGERQRVVVGRLALRRGAATAPPPSARHPADRRGTRGWPGTRCGGGIVIGRRGATGPRRRSAASPGRWLRPA